MSSPYGTMFDLLAFIGVFGGITVWMTWRVLCGLAVQWRQRGLAQRLAAAEGWRYAGHGQFSCTVGERAWRCGPHEHGDDGRRWTDLDGGVRGFRRADSWWCRAGLVRRLSAAGQVRPVTGSPVRNRSHELPQGGWPLHPPDRSLMQYSQRVGPRTTPTARVDRQNSTHSCLWGR
jgi:hypothetical protein